MHEPSGFPGPPSSAGPQEGARTPERPRLAVFRSNNHIYAQVIDDVQGITLVGLRPPRSDSAVLAPPSTPPSRWASSWERAKDGRHRDRGLRPGWLPLPRPRRRHRRRRAAKPDSPSKTRSRKRTLPWPKASSKSESSPSTASPRSSRAAGGSPSPRSSWWVTARATSVSGTARPRKYPPRSRRGWKRRGKRLFNVPLAGDTITHTIIGEHDAARVLLKPAAPGTGVIAGGAARHPRSGGCARRAGEVARLVERDQRVTCDHQRAARAASSRRDRSPPGQVTRRGVDRRHAPRTRERNMKKTEVTEVA